MVTDKRIIFENENGGVSIIVPSPQWTGTIEELANKDVPAHRHVENWIETGVDEYGEPLGYYEIDEMRPTPYLIIDISDVPTDREYRDAWEVDFSKPDGYGGLNV